MEQKQLKQPKADHDNYQKLFNDIDEGTIKVPQFQRGFVWTKEKTAKLIDSILRGFPIGTFIFWKTKERLRSLRNIGNIELPEPDPGDAVKYVLDGQQRITSLYAVYQGICLTEKGKEIAYKDIVIDLDIAIDDEDKVVFESIQAIEERHRHISVYELLTADIKTLVTDYKEKIDLVSDYKKSLETYDFPIVVIDDYPLEVVCDIFTRINTSGMELTLFEIMVAKTYEDQKFDLKERYDELVSSEEEEESLTNVNYDTIPPVTVLQCIAAHIHPHGSITRKDILKLDKQSFIDSWDVVKDGLFTAADYLSSKLCIKVSKILPYNALLVPLTYFFIKNGGGSPSRREHLLLRQYVYWASLTNRFSFATEGKTTADLKRMESILNGESPDYSGEKIEISAGELMLREFSVGEAFCKAIICLLSQKGPLDFATHTPVVLGNEYLKRANSKNYHHFFPKSFLKKNPPVESLSPNSIMNITLVGEHSNKNVIRAKPPSEYIRKFDKENPNLNEALATHYILPPDEMGIWDDDYETFLKKRSEMIAEELNGFLNPDINEIS